MAVNKSYDKLFRKGHGLQRVVAIVVANNDKHHQWWRRLAPAEVAEVHIEMVVKVLFAADSTLISYKFECSAQHDIVWRTECSLCFLLIILSTIWIKMPLVASIMTTRR